MAKFTQRDKINILTLLYSGESKTSICKRFGIGRRELTIWAMRHRRYGLRGLGSLRYKHYTEEHKQQIVSDYLASNRSLRQTAVDLNISLSTLKGWIKRCQQQGDNTGN